MLVTVEFRDEIYELNNSLHVAHTHTHSTCHFSHKTSSTAQNDSLPNIWIFRHYDFWLSWGEAAETLSGPRQLDRAFPPICCQLKHHNHFILEAEGFIFLKYLKTKVTEDLWVTLWTILDMTLSGASGRLIMTSATVTERRSFLLGLHGLKYKVQNSKLQILQTHGSQQM